MLLSGLTFMGAAGFFLNFWAAVDLGYGGLSGGKAEVAVWGYALIGFFACAIVLGILAFRSRWSTSKGVVDVADKELRDDA